VNVDQKARILVGVLVLILVVGAVLGVDALQRRKSSTPQAEGQATSVPGSVPIYVDGQLAGSFTPADLEQLDQASFVDAEEAKTQEGWLLADVLRLHVDVDALAPEALVTVSSSSREKSVDLTWAEVADPANSVMFDLSGRGTLKLVSVLERLDVRDEWVQDVDRIQIDGQ
jgi:hypothetical protein